jgi:peptidoglycan/LPS O-acetylase OafA/YrhL
MIWRARAIEVATAAAEHDRLWYVEPLKGIAALAIVAVHTAGQMPIPERARQLLTAGQYAVQLFFLLSAFTCLYSLERRRLAGEGALYSAFALRRLVRIVPLFVVAVVIYTCMSRIAPPLTTPLNWRGSEPVSIGNLLSHLTLTFWLNKDWINHIIGVEWAIGVFVVFYVVIPIVHKRIKTTGVALAVLLGLLGLALVWRIEMSRFVTFATWAYWFPLSHLYILPVAYLILSVAVSRRTIGRREAVAGLTALAIFAVFILPFGGVSYVDVWWVMVFGSLIGILELAADLPRTLVRTLDNRATRLLGRVGYSLYLWHPLVIGLCYTHVRPLCARTLMGDVAFYAVLYAAAFLIALASYYTIEKPILSWARRYV